MRILRISSVAVAFSLLAQPSLGAPDNRDDQDGPPIAKQVWVTEKVQCPIGDAEKAWELKDGPKPDDPLVTPANLVQTSWPDFGEDGHVHFRTRPVLQLVIDTEGHVERIGVIRGEEGDRLTILVESVTQWEFTAATRDGRPICSIQIVGMSSQY